MAQKIITDPVSGNKYSRDESDPNSKYVAYTDPVTTPTSSGSLKGTMTQGGQNTAQPSPTMAAPTKTDPMAFNSVIASMRDKLAQDDKLTKVKNLVFTQLYDRPLSSQEKSALTPGLQRAMEKGDRNLIDLEVRLINDQIKNRTASLDNSLKYLVDGYKESVAAAESERQNAIQSVLSFAQLYGDQAGTALRSLYGDEYVSQLQDMGIDVDGFGGIQTLAQKEAAAKADGGGSGAGGIYDMLDFRTANAVLAEANKFETSDITKKYNAVVDATNVINGFDPNTKNPADHQALVYAFAKALDPDSVVREGEYATIKKYSQGLASQYKGELNQAINGSGFLSPEAISGIQKTVNQNYTSRLPQYQNAQAQTAAMIDRIAGQPVAHLVMTDYTGGFSQSSNNPEVSKMKAQLQSGEMLVSREYPDGRHYTAIMPDELRATDIKL